jgi:hydroxypyruvate isomerase
VSDAAPGAGGRSISRREAVGAMAGVAASAALAPGALAPGALAPGALAPGARALAAHGRSARGGRLRQSVSRWCYAALPLTELCAAAKSIGLAGIDLLDEQDWGTPKQYGLTCAMANGFGSIPKGFNRPDNHDRLVADAERMMPLAAAAGVPNIVCFSGNRAGMSDGEGIANCIAGFRRITPTAERVGVTLCLELLNSKVDHHDYHADHTAWGVQVVEGVASPRFRLLYDIYHMQIMEGDIVATIRANAAHIAHYHTGGVPGRHEIDATQELNYRRVAQAIADAGFAGFLAHEFVPARDPVTSLAEAFAICDV